MSGTGRDGGQQGPRPTGVFGALLAQRARDRAAQAALDAVEALFEGDYDTAQSLLREALSELRRAEEKESQ
jgi:uncharacterized protein HemY